MKKRILIVYAPYGSGHKSIANCIGKYFEDYQDKFEVKILDIAKYANILGKATIKGFDFVIKHRTSRLFSFIYDIANNKVVSFNQMMIVKKSFDNQKIRNEIIDFNPDLTISTHFFASNLVSHYNKLGLTNSKIVTVITDYATHSFWQKDHESQDAFIVANDIVKNVMIKKGINTSKIYAFGLPFDHKKLKGLISKQELCQKYKLNPNYKTFLFFGGGATGALVNFDYLKAIIRKKYPINIIFISGNNQKLENKAKNYVTKNSIKNVKILGFTNEVYNLLNASDVVITKPGGATITECIDMKVPVILIPGNGGPEKYNARFICKKKYGTRANGSLKLCWTIDRILKKEKILKNWQSNLEKEQKNESTKKIFELCIKLLK